ncbi:unnamed protein product, partial [Polarella glacialis]
APKRRWRLRRPLLVAVLATGCIVSAASTAAGFVGASCRGAYCFSQVARPAVAAEAEVEGISSSQPSEPPSRGSDYAASRYWGPAEPEKLVSSDLTIGQTVEAKTVKRIREAGYYVDIGAQREAIIDAAELTDGFPRKGQHTLRVGQSFSARVLRVTDGRAYLTRRSGSLDRPALRGYNRPDVSKFAGLVADAPWLEAEVSGMALWGIFVVLRPPGHDEQVEAMVHSSQFTEDFINTASLGQSVRVKLLGTDAEKEKLELTMKDE